MFSRVSILCATFGALLFTAISITFGVLLLVPANPFEERNIGAGVALCVLGGMGVFGLVGGIFGGIVGWLLGCPCIEESVPV